MRLFTLTVIIYALFLTSHCFPQYEFGGDAGVSLYDGDLVNTPFQLSELKPSVTGFAKYYFSPRFAVRAGLSYGKISGDDLERESSDERNLRFQSNIFEFSTLASFDILDTEFKQFVPSIMGGVGIFHHNPKAPVNGVMTELQPLGTEGQGIRGYEEPYKLWEISIPYGVKLKYNIGENNFVHFTWLTRKTFTDHLDDVSRRDYVPPSILIQNGETAVAAAYMADEAEPLWPPYSAFEDPIVRERFPRSLSEGEDMFHTIGFGFSLFLPDEKRSQIRKNRKGVPNRYSR